MKIYENMKSLFLSGPPGVEYGYGTQTNYSGRGNSLKRPYSKMIRNNHNVETVVSYQIILSILPISILSEM